MSFSNWDVTESAEQNELVVHGGTVNLDALRIVSRPQAWQIEKPGKVEPQTAEKGGEISLSSGGPNLDPRPPVSRGVINFGLIVLIVLVAMLVVNDTIQGDLTFAQFVQALLSFLAGLGLGKSRGGGSSGSRPRPGTQKRV